ncbi:MAG: ABC transporter ATP-binding protein [Clostridiales bacterium]|jgi:iron complex transport system ATP-binding protein|nr:ABC transporter ATP-binding protein [Clostridiales bacterium]
MYFGFEDITIQFGKKRVISGLSVDFPRGKITTVIGRNGCGKSSLLKAVFGAVTPLSGRAVFDGRPISAYKPKVLARRIAYLPQVYFVPPDIDVYTMVSYGRYPHSRFARGLTRADADVIERCVRLTGLTGMERRVISTLSGGERQRVRIAMTICQEPEMLVLDEPTTYLDISCQLDVLELVKRLNRDLGITIVMVLHDINMAARYSDYLYAIKSDSVCAGGTPSEIVTKRELAEIFRVEAEIHRDEKNDCPYFIPYKNNNNFEEQIK